MSKVISVGDIPITHIKDYQRQRVYEAEDCCMFWGDSRVLTYEEAKNLIDRISFHAKITPPEIIEDGHQPTYATKDKIYFTYPSLKNLPTICHEMAHVINYNGKNADHHGKYFCGRYLDLVKNFIGIHAYKDLVKAFRKHKIDYIWYTQIDH